MGSVGSDPGRRLRETSNVSGACERRGRLRLLLKIRVPVVRFRPWPPFSLGGPQSHLRTLFEYSENAGPNNECMTLSSGII